MNALEQEEREKYQRVWAKSRIYDLHSPGLEHAPQGYGWMLAMGCATLMDWGCGNGRAMSWFYGQHHIGIRSDVQ